MDDTFSTGRILVGVDGSEPSIDALRFAAHIARVLDAPLEAVTAWTYPAFSAPATIIDWAPDRDAGAVLDDAIESAFGSSPPTGIRRHVVAGPAARTLIEMSRDSAMLVVGSRGRGGFAGLLLGSVSGACAEHAHCPVLIMHGPARDPLRA